MKLRMTAALSLLAIVTLAGCATRPDGPEQAAAAVEDRTPQAPAAAAVTAPVVVTPQTDPYALAALKDPKSPLATRTIFFDLDSFVVKSEYQPLLQHHARFLATHAQMKMLLQGHADERGSREYNLALGQKRAEAVKRALVLLGAREDQIEAVSLGEEKPACTESTETCWAQNRRGDILYSGEF